ncbi:MAG: GTPase HflX [Gammaproteobacteria bacterium]|nr:MAG: GTPase HflX [Gammaproteobacteria bacterium]
MFERPRRGERAIIVHVGIGRAPDRDAREEFTSLARAAGAEVAGSLDARLSRPNPRHLVGRGKLEAIRALAADTDASLVLVDHALTPAQERNLERVLERRVVDRAGLILDIFALRARSHEGKLQVELAQLEHLSTRLVRGWTHLERQKGGIGLRGPGETQLESDRRMLGQRLRQLQSRLDRLARRRELGRRQRRRAELPTVSLVGYTNAGKSTLFNRLTDAGVPVADQLFATLDPTLRRLELPGGSGCVLADTVGFVSDLPHELVAAFHSTLEETRDARLLLHVVDCSDPARSERIAAVETVLAQIGAERLPRIQVFNKADILAEPARIETTDTGMPRRVWLSAASGEGVDLLLAAIAEFLHQDRVRGTVRLGVRQGRLRAVLYEQGQVLAERTLSGGGWELEVELDRRGYEQLQRREALAFLEPAAGERAASLI